MADDRLDQQAGQRRRDPQDGQRIDLGAQGLEDAAGVGVLQAEADLDAEEADAHVPDRQAGQARAAGEEGHAILPRDKPEDDERGVLLEREFDDGFRCDFDDREYG